MKRIDYAHYYRVRIQTDKRGEFKVKRYDTEDDLLADMENIPNDAWIETVYEHGRSETIIGKEEYMSRTHPEWDLSNFISDMEWLISEIDDVLPNGMASKVAHSISGKWRAIRWNFEDRCNKDAVKYREDHYPGEQYDETL